MAMPTKLMSLVTAAILFSAAPAAATVMTISFRGDGGV